MTRPAPLLPAFTVEAALVIVQRSVATLPPMGAESIALHEGCGRIVAEALAAPWPLPAADVSMMDGWAVRCADVHGAETTEGVATLAVSGSSAAGHPSTQALARGQVQRIFTGAVLPSGADAVIPQEDVDAHEGTVEIDAAAAAALSPGRFVRRTGSEVAQGEELSPRGTRLTPGDLALLASCGHARIRVHRRPRVAILSTGDELVPLGTTPGPGQIVSSNGLMLAAQVTDAGGEAVVLPDAPDDREGLAAALEEGLRADVLLTSGGISVGDFDLVRASLQSLGADIHVHGLALRPGKPTAFATRGTTAIFALPGNPASAWVAFELLVRPALRARAGDATPRSSLRMRVTLAAAIRGAGQRAHYIRARWAGSAATTAEPLSVQNSGDLRSIGGIDLLLVVPIGVAGYGAGESCEAIVLRPPPEAPA